MVLLDSYFYHLQAHTGAQRFVIVRDDALRIPSKECYGLETHPASPTVVHSEELVSPSRLQRRSVKRRPPTFDSQRQDYQPPCPPTRVESVDDLVLKERTDQSSNRSLYQPQGTNGTTCTTGATKISPDLRNRFISLFGTEMHSSSLTVETSKNQPFGKPEQCYEFDRRIEIKALASLAAPKFPIRRGSRDDLSTLPSMSRRRRLHQDDFVIAPHRPTSEGHCSNSNTNKANQKIDLARFLDEVTGVLDDNDHGRSQHDQMLPRVLVRARSHSEHD